MSIQELFSKFEKTRFQSQKIPNKAKFSHFWVIFCREKGMNIVHFAFFGINKLYIFIFHITFRMLILSAIFCRQNIFKKPQKSTQKHPKCASECFCIHDTEPNCLYFPRICNENWRIMQFNIGLLLRSPQGKKSVRT